MCCSSQLIAIFAIGNEKPTEKHLLNWTRKSSLSATNNGRSFAYYLLSSNKNTVDNIFCNHSGGGHERALQEVLDRWFELTINASWGDIVVALNEMNEVNTIEEIEKEYLIK